MAAITDILRAHPTVWAAVKLIVTTLITIAVVTVVLRLEKKASRRLIEKRDNINVRFVESVVRFVIIFLAVQWIVMSSALTQSFGRVLFQGTAIIGAIAGFAAQPVIADMICGLMMSANKPFDIGDRIELEDGTAGIVKDITLRHVVLNGLDTAMLVIPNSKLNGMRLTNMSTESGKQSVQFRFNVAYDTDVAQAMAVIREAVEESPYSIPGKPGARGDEYGPVYFIEYAASSLVMTTTVYFEPSIATETVKSDINSRVKRALDENGIEIPYDYLNVVMGVKEKKEEGNA